MPETFKNDEFLTIFILDIFCIFAFVIDYLKNPLDLNLRNEAEKELTKVHKIIGFGPVLLQVIMSGEVELPTRQAAVIYLKNMVSGSWVDREPDTPGQPIPFAVHEQDRALIR